MATTSIVILIAIVAAFALFGIFLAWGEYQTRHLARELKQRQVNEGTAEETVIRVKFDQVVDGAAKADLTKAA
jgi:cell division protein FtsL